VFKFWGLGFRFWGLGFGFWGGGCWGWGLGVWIWGLGFRVWGLRDGRIVNEVAQSHLVSRLEISLLQSLTPP